MLFSNVVHKNVTFLHTISPIQLIFNICVPMTWCFSIRASVATVLSMHPFISSCLLINFQSFGHLHRYDTVLFTSDLWGVMSVLEKIDVCYNSRVDSRFAPSEWETSLQSNAVSHWLGANLILGLSPANERHRYKVTSSLIGWAQT